jgi:hypothetical protein
MKIGILPDVQAKHGVNFKFLARVGRYFAEKRPDIIVNLGDFADMPSMSSYDEKGSKKAIGRTYMKDFAAAHRAMDYFMDQLTSAPGYSPRLELVLGNHENRINRALNSDPRLEGTISMDMLRYEQYGWRVHEFLKVITIRDIAFSHYLTSGVKGLPITSAAALLSKRHMSTVVGHQQGCLMVNAQRADGKQLTGIIAGSCYEHNEDFMGPQGNSHFRGFLMLHDVKPGGVFEPMAVSLSYLKKRYA